MRRVVVLFVALILLPLSLAQEINYLTWGGTAYDIGTAFIPYGDSIFMIGSSNSFGENRVGFVVKRSGDKINFQKIIEGPEDIWIKGAVLWEENIYLVGQIGSTTFENSDAFIAKLDVDGNLEYFKSGWLYEAFIYTPLGNTADKKEAIKWLNLKCPGPIPDTGASITGTSLKKL